MHEPQTGTFRIEQFYYTRYIAHNPQIKNISVAITISTSTDYFIRPYIKG
jgi:hypothetical protein